MPLATAMTRSTTSLTAAQRAYKGNLVNVSTALTGVLSSRLPELNPAPSGLATFESAYEQAQSAALNWINEVLAKLTTVPGEVRDYNSTIRQALQGAQTQAQALAGNPTDPAALEALTTDLGTVTSTFGLVTDFLSGAVTTLQGGHAPLTQAAQQLTTAAGKPQTAVTQLNQDLDTLHGKISSLSAGLVLTGLAESQTLTLTPIQAFPQWPSGTSDWCSFAAVSDVNSFVIPLHGLPVVDDQEKVTSDQTNLGGEAVLQVLAHNFQKMATEVAGLDTGTLLTVWKGLQSDVNQAVTEIHAAQSAASTGSFEVMAVRLGEALTAWDALYTEAGSLPVDLQGNTAQLTVGMTQSQVEQALAAGTTAGIVDFLNTLSVA